jgi:hypothetical protein
MECGFLEDQPHVRSKAFENTTYGCDALVILAERTFWML